MKTEQEESTRDNGSSIDALEVARLYSEMSDWDKFRTGCEFTRGMYISWRTGYRATLPDVMSCFYGLVWPFIAPPLAAGAGLGLWLWAVGRWEPAIAALALMAAGTLAYCSLKSE